MSGFSRYEGAGQVFLGGRLLAEVTRCERTITSNDNEVMTMAKGFAGFSDGPVRVEITFDTAIPKAGYEYDYEDAIVNKRTVTFVFVDGEKRLSHVGRITQKSSSRDTGSAASASCTFVGRPDGNT